VTVLQQISREIFLHAQRICMLIATAAIFAMNNPLDGIIPIHTFDCIPDCSVRAFVTRATFRTINTINGAKIGARPRARALIRISRCVIDARFKRRAFERRREFTTGLGGE